MAQSKVEETAASAQADPGLDAMRSRWLSRHGISGSVVATWQSSDEVNAPALAFTALIQEPTLLGRLDSRLARRIAHDAKAFAYLVAQPAKSGTTHLSALSEQVLSQVRLWERRPFKVRDPDSGTGAAPPPKGDSDTLATICRSAMQHYPKFNERTGRIAVSILGAAGVRGLNGIQPAWARVLAFEAVLYDARCVRGELRETPAPGSDMIASLRVAQAWAAANDLSLLRVPYTGAGSAAMQAVMLSRDAGTLAGLALGLSWGASELLSIGMWEDAEEMHAFAALVMDRSIIMRLDVAEAERVASCAVRYCGQARDKPGSVAAPILPASQHGAPNFAAVLIAAKPALPNGPRSRLTPPSEKRWAPPPADA